MKITYYQNIKTSREGVALSGLLFGQVVDGPSVARICEQLARGREALGDSQFSALKALLPAVMWQGDAVGKPHKNEFARHNGLYVLDLDHLNVEPGEVWRGIAPRREELGIVVAYMTPSRHGLKLVAVCRDEFSSLAENQAWLAEQTGTTEWLDEGCRDMARLSYLVPRDYFYYVDDRVFDPAFGAGRVLDNQTSAPALPSAPALGEVQQEYRGLPLRAIAERWMMEVLGGMPREGERNNAVLRCASELRYITDNRPEPLAAAMPALGLTEQEVLRTCRNACEYSYRGGMPQGLRNVIEGLRRGTTTRTVPGLPRRLPPVWKQLVGSAPEDFKSAVALCLLPILGTLGSRLRSRYINGKAQSPSFLVTLEAPQASGKSFASELVKVCLWRVREMDEREHEKENAYREQLEIIRAQGTKGTRQEREEVRQLMENAPRPLVRLMPATASTTKVLIRLRNADGTHLFAFAPELDTVTKSFGRGFANLSDLLRCAFDNEEYGQDYASDTSFSGRVAAMYNTLYCGTPRAVGRFYKDWEDGTTSRTLFVTLPDQFGKQLPEWRTLTAKERGAMESGLARLDAATVKEGEVQPVHEMKMDFLNRRLEAWLEEQRQVAVAEGDRTRDTFRRRCAEVGFRAGMLAWYLYGETERSHRAVNDFAVWVAEMMLGQFLTRVDLGRHASGGVFAQGVLEQLGERFSRLEASDALRAAGYSTEVRAALSLWRKEGAIVEEAKGVYRRVA